MFRISKIEQRELPRTPEHQTDESEFEIVLRFSTKDLQWGWKDNAGNVIRAAITGISPTLYVA